MKFTKEEVLNSKRIFKSATPKQDLSWYVKWTASTLLLSAMVFRAEGLFPLADLILSFTGCMGWLWVGLLWKDRALIILNAVAVVILGGGLLRYNVPMLIS